MICRALGTATGTRLDSAAKHIMACKVDSRLLSNWIPQVTYMAGDVMSYLHNNKMKWCMHKDEIVLNSTKKINLAGDSLSKAYPLVISSVGEMNTTTKHIITALYAKETPSEFMQCVDSCAKVTEATFDQFIDQFNGIDTVSPPNQDEKSDVVRQISTMPEFRCQGVALGQAWANYLSGDTVASVLVGGMMTVQNRHFTVHTGDQVQWYFTWESPRFNESTSLNGCRHLVRESNASERKRKFGNKSDYMDSRLYGTGGHYGKSVGQKDTSSVVRIKSYRMITDKESMFCQDHYGDKIRIFAKCISGGRPFDMVDIMLMTQSS
jgi:hypothetical protein